MQQRNHVIIVEDEGPIAEMLVDIVSSIDPELPIFLASTMEAARELLRKWGSETLVLISDAQLWDVKWRKDNPLESDDPEGYSLVLSAVRNGIPHIFLQTGRDPYQIEIDQQEGRIPSEVECFSKLQISSLIIRIRHILSPAASDSSIMAI
jgi:hypothetical protein